jgi:hypothetical protein
MSRARDPGSPRPIPFYLLFSFDELWRPPIESFPTCFRTASATSWYRGGDNRHLRAHFFCVSRVDLTLDMLTLSGRYANSYSVAIRIAAV